ncbi:MAG: hypothetical protein IJ746_05120 [Ruminococcus sp.]|nr:hypothetical protein [Ruminococcus sp.]
MNDYKNPMKKILGLAMAAVTALSMTTTAFADEPYNSYNYDTWDDPVPSQSVYRVEATITGAEMELERLRDPSDPLFYDEKAELTLDDATDMSWDDDRLELWIADTKNNRIIVLDENLKLKARYYTVEGSGIDGFAAPGGIFVNTSPSLGCQVAYIADTENSRIVKAKVVSNTKLEFIQDYTKPDSSLYTIQTFLPRKVLADGAENVYSVVSSISTGSVQFAKDGSFTSYYGANRVQVTAAVIAQRLWRAIASDEQLEGMQRNVPVEYANFDIDKDGFIYTVTEVTTDTDAVKKLNAAGYNIWNNTVGNEYKFGDLAGGQYDALTKKSHNTRLTDVDVSSTKLINVLDYETGRVFQYDEECNLIAIFGTKNSTSDQRGSLSNPNAVESYGDKVFILDGSKNDITVFVETQFGKYVHNAFALYDQGLYTEAKGDWEEVIKRDGGYTTAYIGLGKAALKNEEYSKALKYFKTAYDQDDYDKAFKYTREAFLRDNFTAIVIVIVLIIALLIARSVMKKKGIRLFKRKPKKLNIDDGFGILSSAEEKAAEDTEEVAEEVEEAAAEVSSSEIEAEDAEETEADEASEDEEKEGE